MILLIINVDRYFYLRHLKIEIDQTNSFFIEGSLRVDANVSVNRLGQSLGTRTEIKNLNSTRAVARAIDYEIARQIDILESGGVIFNETRGFDSQLKETVSMRDKEAKQDYRFMPEPNLLPLHLSHLKIDLEDLLSRMPTLPEAERCFLMNRYQMNLETAVQLVVNYFHYCYYYLICYCYLMLYSVKHR